MEKMPGVQLRQVWDNMKLVDKMNLRLDVALHQAAWLSVSFSQFGGLYYAQDMANVPRGNNHLYSDNKGNNIQDGRFAIGPATGRDLFDCGRARLDCDRGPCELSCPQVIAVVLIVLQGPLFMTTTKRLGSGRGYRFQR